MTWKEFAQFIISVFISSGLLLWFVQTIIKYFIDRRFKAYEVELQHKSDDYKNELNKSLEAHKTQLNLVYTKASKLHDKRLVVIERLYRKLIVLDMAMKIMTANWKLSSGDKEQEERAENDRIKNAIESYNGFFLYFYKHQIFFSEEICKMLEALRTTYYDSLWDYTAKITLGFGDQRLNIDQAVKASDAITQKIPSLKERMEKDFRDMLGVD